jgi:hypothetical protein
MRTFDFGPLYRSTVGFDRMFSGFRGALILPVRDEPRMITRASFQAASPLANSTPAETLTF